MKTRVILSALLPVILLASCKKDNGKAPGPLGPINYNDYANGGIRPQAAIPFPFLLFRVGASCFRLANRSITI